MMRVKRDGPKQRRDDQEKLTKIRLNRFSKQMDKSAEFLLKHKLWKIPFHSPEAFRWDEYIRTILLAIRDVPILMGLFKFPLNAMYWMAVQELARFRVPPSVKDEYAHAFLSMLVERVQESRQLRITYTSTQKGSPENSAARAALKRRGLL